MEGCADRSEGHVMTSGIKTLKGGKLHRRVLLATGGTESSRTLSGSREAGDDKWTGTCEAPFALRSGHGDVVTALS